ncbi:voltage-dependent calcium channel subunit alpha-2/delta-3-like [Planococcus citri]|uniref:voltage-dependent calcium channel subunit alpha-2/delta-3-like n=1 Tax=Planococcus citri TaxID=170843 RepID=UPI0031F7F372
MLAFRNYYLFLINVVFFTIFAVQLVSADENDNNIPKTETETDVVLNWANDIGNELWKIGERVTKLQDIKQRYVDMNASVEPTNGTEILNTIVVRMNKLIKEKVDAVMRLQNATQEAESQKGTIPSDLMARKEISYRNSKFSDISVNDPRPNFNYSTYYEVPENLTFESMNLSVDPHFNYVLVNTDYSSVHVPTNIYDRWDRVIEPIVWSEKLDETFKENYDKDTSLMWQYFASTSGFLRHFPAYRWAMEPDKYDCRKRIWYVQAATCSKEVIILIDNSGTMYGMRNTIAQLTVDTLLQTFSNNDFVNLFQMIKEEVHCLVDCFNDTLVQATPENVELFKKSLYDMCPDNKINFTKGFIKAFEMLHDFIQNKTEQSERRNQAIFLLTDQLPSQAEFDVILREYKRIYGGPNMEVDLFIYFIGKDIVEVNEVQWGSKCLKPGSIVHVRTMDEVPEDALKYLPVIARTQNENTQNYPVSWTHVFLDIKRDRGSEMGEDQPEVDDDQQDHPEYGNLNEPFIMTSVTTPVYKKINLTNPTPGKEEMIGVAAIDVPVADFERLVISHKIGVNGYAFIVTNNGYLLFHPDLTPVKDKTFRVNFNSVDLTEIEFYDDNENEPRKPNERIVELRRSMVNQERNLMENMTIKFHYDSQTRVGSELRSYFYAPLRCSPFTLGLALPKGYGNYWIKADETKLKDENYSHYFETDGNWNIHPKWTYCDFRTRQKYDYRTPKKKLQKFLSMMFEDKRTRNFTWHDEHQIKDADKNIDFDDTFATCFTVDTTFKPEGDYFCDRELMDVLFFDAKLTFKEFANEISPEDKDFFTRNGIQVKFVSTQSGLTRWKVFNETATSRNFGETNNKALDEVWYKSAVLLHESKHESFVFSLPKKIENSKERYITASHAIFYSASSENEAPEAPGVVVGYEMAYENFCQLISNNKYQLTESVHFDNYIIDANGYIVYTDAPKIEGVEYLGRFFGEIEGAVMQALINESVFRQLTMFDYQAFTNEDKPPTPSRGSFLFNPFNHLIWMVQWMFSKMLWVIVEANLWPLIDAWKYCSEIGAESSRSNVSSSAATCAKAAKKYLDRCRTREEPAHIEQPDENQKTIKKIEADKKFSLYLSSGHAPIDNSNRNGSCARPFKAHRIPRTNLILISLNMSTTSCDIKLSVQQEIIQYYNSADIKLITDRKKLPEGKYIGVPACNKKFLNSYPRKKLRGCSDKQVLNSTQYEPCGSNRFFSTRQSLLITLLCNFLILFHYLRFC